MPRFCAGRRSFAALAAFLCRKLLPDSCLLPPQHSLYEALVQMLVPNTPGPRPTYLPGGPTYLPGGRPRVGKATYLPGGRSCQNANAQRLAEAGWQKSCQNADAQRL